MEFVDSHCHLDDRQYAVDRDAVIQRAIDSGLRYMLAIGTGDGPPDLEAAVRMAEAHDRIFATVGVHPNDAAKVTDGTLGRVEELLRHPKVAALGEIGLDYHWDTPKDIQLPLFQEQLALAANAQKPVIVHTRDAWDDTLAVLRSHWAGNGLPCVMHCFTGNVRQAEECLALGFYLAFGGVATFPKAGEVREAARITPSNRLLLETDAPYLAPIPYRGKRNEPAYLLHTAQALAEVRNCTLAELATHTTSTFERILLPKMR
ncbi:MAG: TatD family hydrolase [Bryobacteraceae bacterium]